MRRLRDSMLMLLIHLTIVFNIERLDLDVTNVINLETAVYGLTIIAVILTLSIKSLKSLQQPVLLLLWAGAYFAMKLMLLSQRPLLGDIYTYLSFTELGLFLIAVFLAQKLALNIEEFEQALKNFAFARLSKIKRVQEAQGEIQAEIYRSRRFQRPLSLIVLEQDGSTAQANINKVVQDAQRSLMEHYVSVMIARELSAQLRQTDILLEHDKKGRLVIVSPDTDNTGTEAFVNRLNSLNRSGLFSVNFGAATFPNHALTFEQLLEHAEMNLQQEIDGRISAAKPVDPHPLDSHIDSSKEVKVG
jgi:hypothetical protein